MRKKASFNISIYAISHYKSVKIASIIFFQLNNTALFRSCIFSNGVSKSHPCSSCLIVYSLLSDMNALIIKLSTNVLLIFLTYTMYGAPVGLISLIFCLRSCLNFFPFLCVLFFKRTCKRLYILFS